MKKWIFFILLGATLASAVSFIIATVIYEDYVIQVLPVRDNSWVYFEYLLSQRIWVPYLWGIVTVILGINSIWCWHCVKLSEA